MFRKRLTPPPLEPRTRKQERRARAREPVTLSEAERAQWWRERGRAELCQILCWRWDPIHVADDFPDSRSEYDLEADRLGGGLGSPPSIEDLVDQLSHFATDDIGVSADREHDLPAAAFGKPPRWAEGSHRGSCLPRAPTSASSSP